MPTWQFKPDPRRPETQLTRFQTWFYHVTVRRRYRYVNAVAARRSGKTAGIRLLIWDSGLDNKPGDVGYMAPTRGQVKRTIWIPLMRDLQDPAAKLLVKEIDRSELAIEFVTGTRFYTYSADAPERVRGDGFKRFFTDESDDPKYTQDIFDEAIGPALSKDRGQLVQTGTPKGKGRLYKEWCKGDPKNPNKDPHSISCQVKAIDAELIPIEEIKEARDRRPPRAFRQEYEASFENAGVYIYGDFDPVDHVVRSRELPRQFDEVVVGVDWGEAKRGVMLVCGIVYPRKDEDGDETDDLPTIYVIEEHSHEREPYTSDGWWKIARNIQDAWAPSKWICDPAQGIDSYLDKLRFVLEKWAREKDNRRTPKVMPADNSVRAGISTVQEFLHFLGVRKILDTYVPPHLFVREDGPHPCDNLIRTMPKYEWKRVRKSSGDDSDERMEQPVKADDHELDCVRYLAHTLFGHIRGHSSRRIDHEVGGH